MTDKQRIITIRSKDRKSGSIDNFLVSINPLRNIHFWQFQDVLIPMTHFHISNHNDTITFSDPTIRTAVLKHGIYSENGLLSEIKSKMDVVSTLSYTVSKDNINNKITITGTGAFSLLFVNYNNSPYKMLGFDKVDYGPVTSVIAPNIFEINRRYSEFNIYSRALTKHHQAIHSSNKKSSLICAALNSHSSPKHYFQYSHDNHSNVMFRYDPRHNLRDIDIEIRDLDDNRIDFNGVDGIFLNIIVYEM